MAKRIKEHPQVTEVLPGDAFALTKESDNTDGFATMSQIAEKTKELIGDATEVLSGLISAFDQRRLNKLPDTTSANFRLVTDGSGDWAWIPRAAIEGDMLKSVYDSVNDGIVNEARKAIAISGTPGALKVYVTDGGSVQGFVDIATFEAGIATKMTGTPGNLEFWGTNGVGVQGFQSTAGASVLDSQRLAGNRAASWEGTTTDAVSTEIFIDGVASTRFLIETDTAYEFLIRSFHMQDDFSDYRIQAQRGIIANIAGITQLLGTVKAQDAGSDEDSTAGAVVSLIQADDSNDAMKVSATGIAAQTWKHKFSATFNRINI